MLIYQTDSDRVIGKIILKWLSMVLGSLVTSMALAQGVPEGSFALVNGQPLSEALLEINVQANVQRGQTDSPQTRALLAQELIGQAVLAQQARALKLDEDPRVQAQLTQIQQSFLANLLLENFSRNNPVTEKQIEQQYDVFLKEMAGLEQYKVSIITVADSGRAKAILVELQSSKDKNLFAAIAKAESVDPSRETGGELEWLLIRQMVPSVGNVIANLETGKLSAVPIQTRSGWNVVRLDDRRVYTPPTLSQIEPQLRNAAAQNAQADYIRSLRDKASIIQ